MATIRHHLIMETGIMEMVIMVTIHLKNLKNQSRPLIDIGLSEKKGAKII
jgi:hypothetical protein